MLLEAALNRLQFYRLASISHRAQQPPAQNTRRPGCVLYYCCQCIHIGHSYLALFPERRFHQKQQDVRFDYVGAMVMVISLVTARVLWQINLNNQSSNLIGVRLRGFFWIDRCLLQDTNICVVVIPSLLLLFFCYCCWFDCCWPHPYPFPRERERERERARERERESSCLH